MLFFKTKFFKSLKQELNMEEEIEESFDDSKSQKTLKDKKKMGSRTSLDQHKLGGN